MVTPSACHIRRLYRHVQRPCGGCQCGENWEGQSWTLWKLVTWGDGFHSIRKNRMNTQQPSLSFSSGPVEGQDSRGSCADKTPPIGGLSYRSTWGWFGVWGWPRDPQLLVTNISISIDAYIAMNRTAPKNATGGLCVAQEEIEQLDWKLREKHI